MPELPNKNIFRLEHVLDSINKIDSITTDLSVDNFLGNWVIQDAVVRNIEIIGEALNSVDDALKLTYGEVPWIIAKDMRNLLVHEYFRVDMNVVWSTVKENLPELKRQISYIEVVLSFFGSKRRVADICVAKRKSATQCTMYSTKII